MYEVWGNVGTLSDRRPILNSPLIGLIDAASEPMEDND